MSCDGADWLEVRDGMLSTDKWLATYRDPMANGCEGAEPAQAKALGVGPERGGTEGGVDVRASPPWATVCSGD